MISQFEHSSLTLRSKFGRSCDSYRAVLVSGSRSAIFADLPLLPPLPPPPPLSLLSSLPQAAMPPPSASTAIAAVAARANVLPFMCVPPPGLLFLFVWTNVKPVLLTRARARVRHPSRDRSARA